MTTCPNCGRLVDDDAAACPHCGSDVSGRPEGVPGTQPQVTTRTLVLGVIGFVVIAAVLTAIVAVATRPAASETASAPASAPAAATPRAASGAAAPPAQIETPSAESSASMAAGIRDAGENCDRVTQLFVQGSNEQGRTFYNVACADGNSYSISSNGNGAEDRIVSCAELKAISNVDCFKPFIQ